MKSIQKFQWLVLLLTAVFPLVHIQAQKVLLDEPVRAGELTLFPSQSNPNEYYFILDKARIAQKDGKPQFSFVRYADLEQGAEVEVQAGGFVHALVELYVSPEQIKNAGRELQRILPKAIVKGPLMFEKGRLAIVTAMENEQGTFINQVVGIGNAPILDGQKAAIGVELTREGAAILWEAIGMPTTQISFAFEMELLGYRSPKQVIIEADFEQIYRHETFEAAVVTPVFAGEIKTAFEDLFKSGAIKVISINPDEDLEKAKDVAYDKLIKMMMDPTGGNGMASLEQMSAHGNNEKSMLDRATEMLQNARKEAKEIRQYVEPDPDRQDANYEAINYHMNMIFKQLGESDNKENSQKPEIPEMAIGVSYQLKEIHQAGQFRIDLQKFTTGTMTFPFAENLSIKQDECSDCFHQFSLIPDYRDVIAVLDGENSEDFKNYINHVDVQLKKVHENGKVTTNELTITRNSFNQEGNRFLMRYGREDGESGHNWKDYDCRIIWSFFGGNTIESSWVSSARNIITLTPPLIKKNVSFEVPDYIIEKNEIKTVIVKVYSAYQSPVEVRINTGKGIYEENIPVVLPRNGKTDFEYEVIWYGKNGTTIESGRITSNQSFNLLSI